MNIEAIPAELRTGQRFVNWRTVVRDGKPTKKPIQIGTDTGAESDNQTTWGSLEAALAAYEQGGYAGIGRMFHPDDGMVGLDIDDCRDPSTEQLTPSGALLVRMANTYTEISPSGTGVKLWAYADPLERGRNKQYIDGKVEMYSEKRFFTMTTQHLAGTPATVERRHVEFKAIYHLVFGDPKPEPKPKMAAAIPSVALSADRRFAAAMRDPRFERLHRGDISGYDSPSEARMAYWFKAAFYAGGDQALMRAWFEASSLDQRKLARLGDSEMQKAVTGCSAFYDPDRGTDLADGLTEPQAAVEEAEKIIAGATDCTCLLYTSPSPRDS